MISIAPSLRQLRIVMAPLMLALLSACSVQDYSEYRFRMTVEVDTPEGLRTGSSVYQVSAWNTGSMLPDANKRQRQVKGEAVFVALPHGQNLFVLRKTFTALGDLAELSMLALDPAYANDFVESAYRIKHRQGVRTKAVVRPGFNPKLVTFRNITDPRTVEQVNASHLDASFGKGISLRRITVQLTEDRVTWGLQDILPSFGSETGFDQWYKDLPLGDPRQVSKGDFIAKY